jgi:hypothetical protein
VAVAMVELVGEEAVTVAVVFNPPFRPLNCHISASISLTKSFIPLSRMIRYNF